LDDDDGEEGMEDVQREREWPQEGKQQRLDKNGKL
jgi:hypothetical protein